MPIFNIKGHTTVLFFLCRQVNYIPIWRANAFLLEHQLAVLQNKSYKWSRHDVAGSLRPLSEY